MQRLTRGLAAVVFATAALVSRSVSAAPASEASPAVSEDWLVDGLYVHTFAALSGGRGLRLNNPYRLSTQLGETGESLSLTATYADLALGAALGDPNGLQHGIVAHFSAALHGIAQEVITGGYLALYRFPRRFMLLGRVGAPVILEPDYGIGLEAAAGGVALIRSGLGLTAELVYSLFYGAATAERPVTTIPIVSLQIGAWVDYEVLP